METKLPFLLHPIDSEFVPQVAAAHEFARGAHAGQTYGERPFITHPVRVANVLLAAREHLTDHYLPHLLAAALLHDVLEDTATTPEDVRLAFGEGVLRYVWAVTGRGGDRRKRNESTRRKLAQFPRAQDLRVADRIANLRQCPVRRCYLDEHPDFLRTVSWAALPLLSALQVAFFDARWDSRRWYPYPPQPASV